jgi:hypothetical protein
MKKKIKILLLLIVCTCIFNVYAASSSLMISATSIKEGNNYSYIVTVRDATAWNVHVTATGETEECIFDMAGYSDDLSAVSKDFPKKTCKSKHAGTITVILSGDITDERDVTKKINETKTITVVGNNTTNTNTNTSTNTHTNTNTNTNITTNTTKSTNNNLSLLTVEGYTLTKIDDNNYTLDVKFDIETIKVLAIAESSKSIVEGTGEHALEVGDNLIEVKVTSEAGTENVIKIKVTRQNEETKQQEQIIDNGIVREETKESSFNIVTHLIALVIGIVIGFCISLVIKKKPTY